MSTKKKILSGIAVVIFITAAYAYYVWNKPARNVTEEKGIEITAVAIFDSFTTNENRANSLYLNKAIQVTGEVTEIKNNQAGETVIYLKSNDPVFGVNCTFKESPGALIKGNTITFKGVCTGFLSDVIINQGIIIK
ncbi:MAG TPA: hypothetical protein PLA68_16125 [Panacibacter sp.]|nr:hypothetical protein [Panacibacter sp.]